MKRNPLRTWLPHAFAVIIAPLIAAWPQRAQATSGTWVPTAAGTTYDWAAAANWNPGTPAVPNATTDVASININIVGAQTINLNGNKIINDLNLGDSDATHAITLAAGTAGSLLIFGGTNPTLDITGNSVNTISAGIRLDANTTFRSNGSGVTTLSGVISNNGTARSITFNNDVNGTVTAPGSTLGQFVLGSANTVGGTTGTVSINDVRVGVAAISGAFGANAANTVTMTGAGQAFMTGGTHVNNFILNSTGWVETAGNFGALRMDGGTISGSVTMQQNSIIGSNSGTGLINGVVSGAFNLTKAGAGTIALANATNTYNGITTVADGSLQLRTNGALGASSSTVVVTNGGTPAAADVNSLALTGGITVNRNVLLENTGTANSRSYLTTSNAVNANGNTWGGTVTFKGGSNQAIEAGSAPLTLTGAVLNDSVTPSTNVFFRGNSTGTLSSSATVNLGSATLLKTDGGTWNANNTTSMVVGTTQIADGTISVGADNALSTSAPLTMGQTGGTSGTLNIATGRTQTISSITVATGSTAVQRVTGPGALDTGATNRTYTVNDSVGVPQDLIISAPVTGSGGFTKTGAGTLAVNSTVAGPVTISAGRLEGAPTFNGGLTIADATLSPGTDITAGALIASGLTFSGNSTLNLNVGPAGEFISNSGFLAASGTTTVNLTAAGTLPSTGQVNLITHNGTLTGLGSFNLATLPGRVLGTLQNSGTALVLDITGNDKVIWTGATAPASAGEAWDTTTANWKLQSSNAAVSFLQGDDVIFDDTGLNTGAITLNTAAQIAGADFQNTSAVPYLIKGSGGMAGAGAVIKSGDGTVTLAPVNAALAANASAHAYAGTTTVNAGTLVLDYTGLTGTNAVSNRVIGTADIAVAPGATLALKRDNNSLTLPNNLSGGGTVIVDATNGGTGGARNFLFTGNNTGFSGTLKLTATGAGATGTLRTINAAQNGAAPQSAFGTAFIDVDAGAQMWGTAGTYTNNFTITGAGYAEAGGGATPDSDLAALGFANYAGIGAIRMEAGSFYNGNITLQGSAKVSAGTGTATIGGNLTRTNAGDVFVFGGSGNNTVNQLNLTGDNSGLGRIWVNSGGSGGTTAEDILQIGNNGTTGTLGSGEVTLHTDAARKATLRFSRSDGYTLAAGNNIITDVTLTTVADFARASVVINGGGLTMAGQTIDLLASDGVNGGSINVGQANAGAVFNIGAGSVIETKYFGVGEQANNSATVNQTGGSVVMGGANTDTSHNLRIGHWGTNTSAYNISGTATLNFTSAAPATTPSAASELAGGIYVGIDGQGAFNQSGNSVVTTNFVVLDNRTETLAGANMATGIDQYNLSGGRLELKSAYGVIGRFASTELNLSGGTIRNVGADATDAAINVVTNVTSGTTTLDTVNATRKFTLMNNVTGSGTITTTGGGTIELEPDSNTTRTGTSTGTGTQLISTVIAGTSPVTKLGTGTTTLSATNTYNGNTTVSAGRLDVTGATESSAFTVATGAALGGEGSVGALNLQTGSTLLIDGSTTGALTATGALSVTGTANVDFSTAPSTSSVLVLNHAGTTALASNFALTNPANYRASNFTVNAGNVMLDFGRKDLVWAGTTANWEIAGTDLDWNAGADNYFSADGVTFNDTSTLNSTVTLVGAPSNSNIRVNSDTNQFTFNGSTGNFIGGSSTLHKDGTSTLTINAPNTYNGGTVIAEGEIMARTANALGTGTITLGDAAAATPVEAPTLLLDVNGAAATLTTTNNIVVALQSGPAAVLGSTASNPVGVLQANFNGTLTLNDDLKIQSGAGDFTRVNGAITGSGNLEIVNGSLTGDTRGNGGNRVLLVGNANSWTGNITIKAGTATNYTVLQTNTADSLNNNISVTVEDNAVFRLNANEAIDILNGSSAARVRGVLAARTLTVGANNGSSLFAGVMENDPFDTGSLVLTKTGSGTLTLTGSSTYTGATSITGGTIQIGDGGSTGALTASAITLSAGTTLSYNRTGSVAQGGALNSLTTGAGILNVNGDATTALSLNAGGTFSGVINVNNGTLVYGTTNPTSAGTTAPSINLAAGTTLTNSTGSAHGHVGTLTMNAATWTTSAPGGSYDTENYQLNGDVTVTGTAASTITRDAGRSNANSGISLRGSRTFTVNDVTAGVDLTISTELEDTDAPTITAAGPSGLIKAGAGTLRLTADNSYTGPTLVNAGTLDVNGSIATSSSLTVGNGGRVTGSGTLPGAVTFGPGSIIAPGNSPGTITTSGSVSFDATSVLNYEFNGADTTVGGGVNDLFTGITNLTLGGTLNVDELGAGSFLGASLGNSWRIMNYSGTLSGSLTLGTVPALSDPGWSFTVDTSTANQVNLVVVPEASTAGLVGLTTAFLAFRRRRRAA